MKIYTKTGDKGMTGLIGGSRVKKNDKRLEAYGTVDELNSFIGLLVANELDSDLKEVLFGIQNNLFEIGSFLATDFSSVKPESVLTLAENDIKVLENEIDRMNEKLPPLKNFILPGGNNISAICHICRTITRRAERNIQAVNNLYPAVDYLPEYVNRLSDYFFVLARYVNLTFKTEEIYWKK